MRKGLFLVDLVDLKLTEDDHLRIEKAIQEAVVRELASIDQTGDNQGGAPRSPLDPAEILISGMVAPIPPIFGQVLSKQPPDHPRSTNQ
jgi:hypothetical protein